MCMSRGVESISRALGPLSLGVLPPKNLWLIAPLLLMPEASLGGLPGSFSLLLLLLLHSNLPVLPVPCNTLRMCLCCLPLCCLLACCPNTRLENLLFNPLGGLGWPSRPVPICAKNQVIEISQCEHREVFVM